VLAGTATAVWDAFPGTVLAGFKWEGGEGASEVRFDVETDGGSTTGEPQPRLESTAQPAPSAAAEPTTAVESAAAEHASGSSVALCVVLGIAAVVAAVIVVPAVRRRSR
jgi:cobalamin biosynthesis Mg chelatase CobN